jgi:hypothetical protein
VGSQHHVGAGQRPGHHRGSVGGDWLIRRVTATWTIRIGLVIEAGVHLTLATTRSAYLAGFMMFAFGVHGCGASWEARCASG